MNSKVHPKLETKYHVSNWRAYNQALVSADSRKALPRLRLLALNGETVSEEPKAAIRADFHRPLGRF